MAVTGAREFKNYIGGEWVGATSGETFVSSEPATGETLGTFPRSGAEDVDRAVAAAKAAFEDWRLVPAPERGQILLQFARLLEDEKHELTELMSREMGKVLAEAGGDVQEAIDMSVYMAGEGRRLFGQTTPSELRDKFQMSVRMPVGVVGAITPWNFPIAIPAWKAAPALAYGNCVVIKPADLVPGCAWALAEIISRFDVVAVQEVRDDLSGLRMLSRCLGADWSFIVTDVTRGDEGNHERLAYMFDQRRVKPSGLAGELVLSAEDVERLEIGRQFARTPFLVSFVSAGNPLTLASVHVIWGGDVPQRRHEAAALADLLKLAVKDPYPKTPDDFRRNLIALGDFNIAKAGDAGFQALVDNGLTPDPSLADLPRTVGEKPGKASAFDQVAWIAAGQLGALGFDRTASGSVIWDDLLPRDPAEGDATFRISDHYPLWVEFALPAR